jgi:alpha-glucosidase
MNEPASFCYYPCSAVIDKVNVTEIMLTLGDVPPLEPVLEAPGQSTESGKLNLQRPPYAIKNDLPRLSDRTAPVDAVHANGLLEYDTREFEPLPSATHSSQK